jgi:hypothetical protein
MAADEAGEALMKSIAFLLTAAVACAPPVWCRPVDEPYIGLFAIRVRKPSIRSLPELSVKLEQRQQQSAN